MGVLALALVASGPWIGYWTLIPLAAAGIGFAIVERGLAEAAHPEYRMATAWVFAQLAIAGSIAVTGGASSTALAWLAIPIVTLGSRFSARGLWAGLGLTIALMLAATVGVSPGYVAAHPDRLIGGIAVVWSVGILSLALLRSDLEHRSDALIDSLTGLLNRHALAMRGDELAQQASSTQATVALIAADLDHFKAINDGHGHPAGDAVLRGVAQRLREQMRAFDLVYRTGGEEFLLVLPGASAGEAAEVAEQVRAAIEKEPIAGLMVTMSLGVSASLPGSFDYATVFASADLALYEAKHAGRNRISVRHLDAPTPPVQRHLQIA